MAKKLTKKQETEQSLAAIVAGGGEGFEEADSSSYAIPFLRILQKLSPEVDKTESAYVKGAKPGMIFHTVRKEAYDEVEVVPVHYRKTFIEWVLREKGGGFRGEFEPGVGREMLNGCAKNEKNQFIMPNGNHLSETSNHYVMFRAGADIWEPVLISMASSQLKASRTWMSQMKAATIEQGGKTFGNLAMYAFRWVLGTQPEKNDKGKWFGWTLDRSNVVDTRKLVDESKATRAAVAANRITYDRNQQESSTADEDNSL